MGEFYRFLFLIIESREIICRFYKTDGHLIYKRQVHRNESKTFLNNFVVYFVVYAKKNINTSLLIIALLACATKQYVFYHNCFFFLLLHVHE